MEVIKLKGGDEIAWWVEYDGSDSEHNYLNYCGEREVR